MKIVPLEDRILVKLDAPPDKAGSILLPETAARHARAHELKNPGTVIAVGPGKLTDAGIRLPMHLRVGDRVLCGLYPGIAVNPEHVGGERGTIYVFQTEDQIGGIIE